MDNKALSISITKISKRSATIKVTIDNSCYATCILLSNFQINIQTEFVCGLKTHIFQFYNLYENTEYEVLFQNVISEPLFFRTK